MPTEDSPVKMNSEMRGVISWTCKAGKGRFSFLIRLEVLVFGPVETQGLSGLINMYVIKVHQLERQNQFYLALYN